MGEKPPDHDGGLTAGSVDMGCKRPRSSLWSSLEAAGGLSCKQPLKEQEPKQLRKEQPSSPGGSP